MFDLIKGAKYLKPILIIVAVLLALNTISFIFQYWGYIVLVAVAYFGYKFYKSLTGK